MPQNEDDSVNQNYKLAKRRIDLLKEKRNAKYDLSRLTALPQRYHSQATTRSIGVASDAIESSTLQLDDVDRQFLDNQVTSYIASQNLWKLGIDEKDHWLGRLAYDIKDPDRAEPAEGGYIDAMETALIFMFRTANEPLSSKYIRMLHYLSTKNVSLDVIIREHHLGGSEFPIGSGRCPLLYVTKEGLEELITYKFYKGYTFYEQSKIYLNKENLPQFIENSSRSGRIGEGGIPVELDKEQVLEELISVYHQKIASAKTMDERVFVIAQLAKQIESAHFFEDANLRVVRLVILKLLIQNNLSLTCMHDPNIIDGYSSEQIAAEIRKGMAHYQKIAPPSQQELEKPRAVQQALEDRERDLKQIKEQLFKKIDAGLQQLKDMIGSVDNHIQKEAWTVAEQLLATLQTERDVYFNTSSQTFHQVTHESTLFINKCNEAISTVIPILEKDLGWGDFLLNLLKTICNACTFGYTSKFFTAARSQSAIEVELAQIKLNDSIPKNNPP